LKCITELQDIQIRGFTELDSVVLNIDYLAQPGASKEAIMNYLQHPELVLYYTQESFMDQTFGAVDEPILRFTEKWNSHIDKSRANWMQCSIQNRQLVDHTLFGVTKEESYSHFITSELGLSFADDWETRFKIAGISIFRSGEVVQFVRRPYTFL
jgi:hypothetical protein